MSPGTTMSTPDGTPHKSDTPLTVQGVLVVVGDGAGDLLPRPGVDEANRHVPWTAGVKLYSGHTCLHTCPLSNLLVTHGNLLFAVVKSVLILDGSNVIIRAVLLVVIPILVLVDHVSVLVDLENVRV